MYCSNKCIQETRELVNDILEKEMKEWFLDSVKIQEKTQSQKNLAIALNEMMNVLPLNDCRLPGDLIDQNPVGTRITLRTEEWTAIERNREHPLHSQANRWPNLSACGLMTCRGENEWNDDHTCSGDMTYIGALPACMGMCIEEFSKAAIAKCSRSEDRVRKNKNCKNLRTRWNGIEKMTRMKPEVIQRVISAQLDLYRDRLKKKCKENELRKKLEEEEMDEQMTRGSLDVFLEGDGMVVDEPSVENDLTIRTGTLRDCIGKRCQLENRHKQFMSYSAGTRRGAKKCPSCQQFEPALKKVLKMEEYIIG